MLEVVAHPQPETCLDRLLAERGRTPFALAVRFEHAQYYLPQQPVLPLLAVFWRERSEGPVLALVSDRDDLRANESPRELADRLGLPVLQLDAPQRLLPVHIPKPWGQEIWYSGIEARGQSAVGTEHRQIPLPWLLAALPQRFAAGDERKINLLKILDPLPDEVYGDLYFEMHQEKREVYIVTRVDPAAWPNGCGAIRFGFSAEKRAQFASDAAFMDAYRQAVRAYRSVREQVDARFDEFRGRHGYAANEPVATEQLKHWDDQLPAELRAEERRLRAHMDSFTAMRPLSVGDVVSVPTHVPHSLQHGVRTVEFQTPVYERKILSFAQKVLTQGHWDTDEALQLLQLEAPEPEPFQQLESAGHFLREQIVDFADFTVERIRFTAPGSYWLASDRDYCIAMVVGDELVLSGRAVPAESAWLLASGNSLEVSAARPGAALLVAKPKRRAIC